MQVVEKGEDIIFNFVSTRGLPSNGYIAITAPGNMRLKSFQVEGINGESSFTFDVKIRTIQMSYDGTIVSSNTIVNAQDNDPNKIQYISHLDINDNNNNNNNDNLGFSSNEISASLRRTTKPKRKTDTTTLLVFELRTNKNIHLGPGAYRLSFPVAWKSRSRQRFRRELFAIELCDEFGQIIEAAQQLWIIDSESAKAAAEGYTTHPKYGGKINVCAENIRSLRKPGYINQMKIFELGDRIINKNRNNNNRINNNDNDGSSSMYDNDCDGYTSQSWFPSDFTATGSDLNESVSCMNVCKQSGRIVTCAKSLISIWDCDLILRTYRIPHDKYINKYIDDISSLIQDDTKKPKISKYRLGATTSIKKPKKKKIRQMITIRTPPLKILSLHASFMVRLLHIHNNFLAFASDHETRMVYLNIQSHHDKKQESHNIIDNSINIDLDDQNDDNKTNNNNNNNNNNNKKKGMIDDYSSGEDDDDEIIIDIYNDKKRNKDKEKKKIIINNKQQQQQQPGAQVVDLSDTDSDVSVAGTTQIPNEQLMKSIKEKTNSISTMRNVCVVFDEEGCPSIRHHAASFMLIPSIYEFNRFVQSTTKSKS